MPNTNSSGIISLLLIFVFFWFFMIRPQKQQANKRMEMLKAMKTGDSVITIGGICGTIARLTEDKVYIEVAEGIVLEMLRTSISSVETEEEWKNSFEEEDEYLDEDDIYYEDEDKNNIK